MTANQITEAAGPSLLMDDHKRVKELEAENEQLKSQLTYAVKAIRQTATADPSRGETYRELWLIANKIEGLT